MENILETLKTIESSEYIYYSNYDILNTDTINTAYKTSLVSKYLSKHHDFVINIISTDFQLFKQSLPLQFIPLARSTGILTVFKSLILGYSYKEIDDFILDFKSNYSLSRLDASDICSLHSRWIDFLYNSPEWIFYHCDLSYTVLRILDIFNIINIPDSTTKDIVTYELLIIFACFIRAL